jgi:peptidoglycan hydrolase-like protein with peptidoglycan-binding domain
MYGPQVRRAQRALLHNPYGTFDPGPLDGVYGERTAAAVRRAKYCMGFP